MVSNYPSNTAYAWWLMEHFWKIQADYFTHVDKKVFLAYPQITTLSEKIINSPIEAVELNFTINSKSSYKKLHQFIKKNEITSLYFTDKPYFSFQYFILRLMGIKRIVIHDHTPGDRPPVRGLKGFVKAVKNKLSWFTADSVLCVSNLMRERNILHGRIPEQKCIIVQNGINPVICSSDKKQMLRESLNLDPNCILVVTTGRAHPYKRFDFVIECARVVKNKSPDLDIVFLLVGDGPAMPELENLVRHNQLEKSVKLLGFRTDVHDILCASDLALHAALGEGFSLSIIEYMSTGLPVLVPDIPSVRQATTHNETGFIYSKDDTKKVANYILSLATDEKLRTEMGSTAKVAATNLYSLDRCTTEFISAIELIFSSQPK